MDYYFAILAMMFSASTFFFEERVKFPAIFPVLAKRLIYSALYRPFFSALGISALISQIWTVPAGYEGGLHLSRKGELFRINTDCNQVHSFVENSHKDVS